MTLESGSGKYTKQKLLQFFFLFPRFFFELAAGTFGPAFLYFRFFDSVSLFHCGVINYQCLLNTHLAQALGSTQKLRHLFLSNNDCFIVQSTITMWLIKMRKTILIQSVQLLGDIFYKRTVYILPGYQNKF